MINSIIIVSPDYPTSKTIDFVFVDQLCRAMAAKGVKVYVIAPQSLTKCILRRIPIAPSKQIVSNVDGSQFTLFRPKYFSVGNAGGFLKNHNSNSFNRAVFRVGKRLPKPSAIYGHFWESVKAAYYVATYHHIPLFASSGEEAISLDRIGYSIEEAQTISTALFGAIHVSTDNQNQCKECGLVTDDNSIVIPNAINNKLFYPRDKKRCREELSIEDNDFVVAFVGQFNSRKGPLKVAEAISRLNRHDVKSFFIGSGIEDPQCPGIIYKGKVDHDLIPDYLSASDVFVLPTLKEGCCNAIIEAMACGLPIISSDLPFNYDVLNSNNSILVNPENVDEMVTAIEKLYEDRSLLNKLSEAALESVESLTLDKRVDRILNFMNQRINNDTDKRTT